MFVRTRKTFALVGVMAAAAAGGAAYAGAADNSGSGDGRAQRSGEEPLTGATADKVEAAALERVEGGTIIRVETDADHGSAYEAHVRTSDGTEVEVLVNRQFEVTAVNELGPGGPRGRGPHGPGAHHRQELRALARELGVTRAQLRAALDAVGAGDRPEQGDLAADLAKALGVEESDVQDILDANRPGGPRGPGGPGHGPGDLVEALASGLNIDEAKVEDALESLHEQRVDAFAAALAKELGLEADKVADALESLRPPRP
jgi:hypothetical protein